MFEWEDTKFLEATKGREPIGFLVETVKLLGNQKGLALDLGCGAGVDAKFLADNGFQVTAIDKSRLSVDQTRRTCQNLPVNIVQGGIADYHIDPETYVLIMAWNAIPFVAKDKAIQVLKSIEIGLKPGGLFVFGLFGPEDDWAKTHPEMSFFTTDEIKMILGEMNFLKLLEVKQEGSGAVGKTKFWHKIQGILQKDFVTLSRQEKLSAK